MDVLLLEIEEMSKFLIGARCGRAKRRRKDTKVGFGRQRQATDRCTVNRIG